MDDGGIHLAT